MWYGETELTMILPPHKNQGTIERDQSLHQALSPQVHLTAYLTA